MRPWLKICGVLTLAALLTACGGSGSPAAPSGAGTPGAGSASSASGGRVLAWNPNTAALSWYAATGSPTTIATLESARMLVMPCLSSPDGQWLVMHYGNEASAPQGVVPLDTGEMLSLGERHGLDCSLPGGIQFSPDQSRIGLISYTDETARGDFSSGTLNVLARGDGSVLFSLEDTTAFTLYNEGAIILQFFRNTDDQALSADLRWWDGTDTRVLETDIRPLEECRFVSGRVIRLGDIVYTLFGEACGRRGSQWRLMRTDFAGGNSANVAQASTRGAYFTHAATAGLWPLVGSTELLVAYPNGLDLDIADLVRVNLATGEQTAVMAQVVVNRLPPTAPSRFLFTADGRRLALVTRDGNAAETLYIYDLTAPDTEPVLVAGGARSDRISAIGWNRAGTRLFFVSGGDTTGLYVLDLDARSEHRLIVRGTFQGLAVNPEGTLVSLSKQRRVSDTDNRNDLILVEVESQRETVLVEGNRGESALVPFAVR